MKKILSISIITLLAISPSVGWATAGQSGAKPYEAAQSVALQSDKTDETATYAKGTVAEGQEGAGNIVSPKDPLYNVENISLDEGKVVSSIAYVKGAYNAAIERINHVYTKAKDAVRPEVPDMLTVYNEWNTTNTADIKVGTNVRQYEYTEDNVVDND